MLLLLLRDLVADEIHDFLTVSGEKVAAERRESGWSTRRLETSRWVLGRTDDGHDTLTTRLAFPAGKDR